MTRSIALAASCGLLASCNPAEPRAPKARDESAVAQAPSAQATPAEPVTAPTVPATSPLPTPMSGWNSYAHPTLGLSFRYPPRYVLSVGETSPKVGDIHVELNEPFEPPQPDDPPGDPSVMHIGFHFLKGARAARGIAAWTRARHAQALVPREWETAEKLHAVTVAGMPAVLFNADGLWQYDVLIVQAPGFIAELSVEFNAPDDAIRRDFSRIVSTVTFDHAGGDRAPAQPACEAPGPGCTSLMIPVCTQGQWSCEGVPPPP
jgi:hypothetical protein